MTDAEGCVHPASPEQIVQAPEEYQRERMIVVYTKTPLSAGDNFGNAYSLADQILWNGDTWRVIKVKPWRAFGFVQAFAVQVTDITK